MSLCWYLAGCIQGCRCKWQMCRTGTAQQQVYGNRTVWLQGQHKVPLNWQKQIVTFFYLVKLSTHLSDWHSSFAFTLFYYDEYFALIFVETCRLKGGINDFYFVTHSLTTFISWHTQPPLISIVNHVIAYIRVHVGKAWLHCRVGRQVKLALPE